MQICCAVFNCSNRADREKNKSNYHFPSIVKNNGKEGWMLSKKRREKLLAQIFRKDLNERKTRKSNSESNVFCLSFMFFSHKAHNFRFERQIRDLSQLTVIELGRPLS